MVSSCLATATTQNASSSVVKMNNSELNWKAISSCEKSFASKRCSSDISEQTNSVILASNKSLKNSPLQNGFKKLEEIPPPSKIKKLTENFCSDLMYVFLT